MSRPQSSPNARDHMEITMTKGNVPTDVLINILTRLPSSSLPRLKSVSKKWFQIISDPDFAEANLIHQSQEGVGHGIIYSDGEDIFYIRGTPTSTLSLPRRMNLPGSHGNIKVLVRDSCKGLVLFSGKSITRGYDFTLHVANPVTGESFILPPFDRYNNLIINANMAYVDGKIKVVVAAEPGQSSTAPLICGILTLGCGSWKVMHTPVPEHLFIIRNLEPIVAVTTGAFHWTYETGILTLDLGQEKFYQTDITFCSATTFKESILSEWDGCLAVVHPRRWPDEPLYIIWILTESGWMKHPNINIAFFKRLCPWGSFSDYNVDIPRISSSVIGGAKIFFWREGKDVNLFYTYNVGHRVITNFTQLDVICFPHYETRRCTMTAHVNSLISCSSSTCPSSICGEGRALPKPPSRWIILLKRIIGISIILGIFGLIISVPYFTDRIVDYINHRKG